MLAGNILFVRLLFRISLCANVLTDQIGHFTLLLSIVLSHMLIALGEVPT